MLDRQKRMLEVYEYARKHFGIHTQTDFAQAIGSSRAVVSSALNGNAQYLTDNLFSKICDWRPGVFNLDYLLTGNGILITENEEACVAEYEDMNKALKFYIEYGKDRFGPLLAAKDQLIESQRQQIEQQSELIYFLKKRISELEVEAGVTGYMFQNHPSMVSDGSDR